jgi:hypothetical protein
MKIYAIWTQSYEDIYGYEDTMYLRKVDAEAKMKQMMDASIAGGHRPFNAEEKGFNNNDFYIAIHEIEVHEGEQLTI